MSERIKITPKAPESKRNNSLSNVEKSDYSEAQHPNSQIDHILFLQRTIGNYAVEKTFKTSVKPPELSLKENVNIQTKSANILENVNASPKEERAEEEEKREIMEMNSKSVTQVGDDSYSTPQRVSPASGHTRAFSASLYSTPGWGKQADSNDSSTHPMASSNSMNSISWSASAASRSAARPRPVSWGAISNLNETENNNAGFNVIGPPAPTDLSTVQGRFGGYRLGVTHKPQNYKAPDFEYNTRDASILGYRIPWVNWLPIRKKGPQKWYATPKITTMAFEGKADSFYTKPGTYKTKLTERGKKIFWQISGPISDQLRAAEQEHCDDFDYAYQISLKEAERVLKAHVSGKTFGPAKKESAVQQLVLKTIKLNLKYPQLGNDKTKWGKKYEMLHWLTLIRDSKGWFNPNGLNLHCFPEDKVHPIIDKSKITYKIIDKAQIGTVLSSAIIKY